MFALMFLLSCQAAASPVTKHPMQTVQGNSLTRFEQLARFAGAHDALSKPNVRITILAPTDQAFNMFLKDMGITWDYLQQNEALADAILGYHLLLGVTASSSNFTAKLAQKKNGKGLRVMTAAEPYSVTTKQASKAGKPQQWLVRDVQGNIAQVTTADLGEGGHRVHVIDRVLYSGAYWPSFKKLFTTLPKTFSTAAAAITAAGPAAAALVAEGASNTLFLPTDAAFKQAGVSLAAPAADIAALLKNHVIAGRDLSMPAGFKQGAELASAGGPGLRHHLQTGGGGSAAKVLSPNMFVSKAEIHVIDNVLKPLKHSAVAAAAAPAPAAAAATAAPAGAATVDHNRPTWESQTITISKPFSTLKPFFTLTFTLPALTTAPVAMPPATVFAGRKLLSRPGGAPEGKVDDGGLGDGHGAEERDEFDYVQSLELNAEEQAVSVAVNSNGAPGAVSAAGLDAVDNVHEANRFPVNPTYANGVVDASAQLMDNDAGSDGPGQSDD
ncbi:hypothetical protein OEZ85_000792 [Tetradesmus obliquus]|uniref:FAS1 domain-containing protein n=1 Tax=Tetradesmus obliquus TaxID=3088 RepID=A0ABY8UJA5_TETOB|nr:hypothetical protein OEZ85_000792 [Tetradesmus obliquus]